MSAVLLDVPQPAPGARVPDWSRWPLDQAMRLRVAVVRDGAGQLWGVTPAIDDVRLREVVERRAGPGLCWHAVTEAELNEVLAQGEQSFDARGSLVQLASSDDEQADAAVAQALSVDTISRQSSPVVKLLDATLFDALKAQASDLHMESTAHGMVIRHRLDGVMVQVDEVGSREVAEQLVSRLKVMAELDIGERRLPQDGRFKLRVQQSAEAGVRDVDFRVSIMPSSFGEDAVLRILDRCRLSDEAQALSLEGLGFDSDDSAVVRRLAGKPYGMLLVTGPTGSGKTTTLYAVVQEVNDGKDKIITIEDPVEYQLPGVVQIPVNDKKGLTFARGLRSILRHDPDRVMVGEIRDAETAQIASQAALTGHLVLSTIHANNVFDVFGRFTHMGIDPYAFASALNGIWAQRLLRVNCQRCGEAYTPSDAEIERFHLDGGDLARFAFRRGSGCGDCRGTGYRGRKAVAEILNLNDELRELIIEKRPIRQLKEVAYRNGTRSLTEAALRLVARGETTLEELRRVTLSG